MRVSRPLSYQTGAGPALNRTGLRLAWRVGSLSHPGKLVFGSLRHRSHLVLQPSIPGPLCGQCSMISQVPPPRRLRSKGALAILQEPAALHGVELPRMGHTERVPQVGRIDAPSAAVVFVARNDLTTAASSARQERVAQRHWAARAEV